VGDANLRGHHQPNNQSGTGGHAPSGDTEPSEKEIGPKPGANQN